jgi:protoporphyrinogen oxidase
LEITKYLILGAGPSGLTFAHSLIEHGVPQNQVLLIEKEAAVGGLCRSEQVDGTPLDIGGGHFLDTKNGAALRFLLRFMPEHEWNTFSRVSKIRLRGREIDYPLEANLWQLTKSDQVDYLEAIAQAGSVRGEPMPEAFSDWIAWKLGARIAQDYMLPYNRKLWSMDLNELGTYWLHKLPDVSFRETLRSCLDASPLGTLPAHASFLYPKQFGYGEIWRRMGRALGNSLITNCAVESVDLSTRTINGRWRAETIINTIPWPLWRNFCEVPQEVQRQIAKLRHIPIDIDYVQESLNDPSHWIYEPNEAVSHHRLLLRPNFCNGARGYWTETNAVRSKTKDVWRHTNDFAYPVNTLGKPQAVERILRWAASQGVVGAGRWGKWEHMNSDVVVAEALSAVASHLDGGSWA